MNLRRTAAIATIGAGFLVVAAAPASAGHDHYVITPAGCHAVAGGQTAIADPRHGGYHRFHTNVHLGAGQGGTFGNSNVKVAKGVCP